MSKVGGVDISDETRHNSPPGHELEEKSKLNPPPMSSLERAGVAMDVFCSWGDGPDVGINLTRTNDLWPANFFPLDFTAKEARALAAQLVWCAEQAESIQAQAEDETC